MAKWQTFIARAFVADPNDRTEVVLVASSCVVALCAYRLSGWRAFRNLAARRLLALLGPKQNT